MFTALSTIAAGSWDLDLATGQLKLCSYSRQMFGLDPCLDSILTEGEWISRLHPDDLLAVREAMTASIVHRRPYAERFRTIHPDGTVRSLLGIGGPTGNDGEHARFGGLNFDLTSAGELAARCMAEHSKAPQTDLKVVLRHRPDDGAPEIAIGRSLPEIARAVVAIRNSRENWLGRSMLGEPAFDLLLALYLRPEPDDTSLAALSKSAGVAYSSAARWIGYLIDKGLVHRSNPHRDRRAIAISLTNEGRAVLEAFLRSIHPDEAEYDTSHLTSASSIDTRPGSNIARIQEDRP